MKTRGVNLRMLERKKSHEKPSGKIIDSLSTSTSHYFFRLGQKWSGGFHPHSLPSVVVVVGGDATITHAAAVAADVWWNQVSAITHAATARLFQNDETRPNIPGHIPNIITKFQRKQQQQQLPAGGRIEGGGCCLVVVEDQGLSLVGWSRE